MRGRRTSGGRHPRLRAWGPGSLLGCACALLLVAGSLAGASRLPESVIADLRAAEEAYAAGEYERAASSYREVLAAGWESASLYYNLGSACHRMGERGWALAYLESARRMAPRDPDIRHNLALVRRASQEGGLQPESSWLLLLLSGLLDALTPAGAIGFLLVSLWLIAIAFVARGWLAGAAARWARRALLGALCLGVAAGGLLALKAYQVHSAPGGVVVARQTEARSGPLASETVRFALPAGTLVHLGRATGEWREIRLSGDMRGWVPSEAITELRRPHWWP